MASPLEICELVERLTWPIRFPLVWSTHGRAM